MRHDNADEGFLDKVKADALRWRQPFTVIAFLRLLILQPGFQLAFSIRLQELCGRLPFVGKILRRILWYITTIAFGSDISVNARFGSGIYFPHPHGIIIGENCVIRRDVRILQNVTLGRRTEDSEANPTIDDGTCVNAGAVIVGDSHIGKNAVIGANAVVLHDIPDNAIAVGVPARILQPMAAGK